METPLKAGMIGLGAMGAPMARHMAQSGLLETFWNRTGSRALALAEELHIDPAADPADLARRCNVIVICVSADKDLQQVVDQCEVGLQPGSVIIDTSTVSPATAQRLAAQVCNKDVGWIDAPVSGGVEGAEKGTLSVMAGGNSADIVRIRPVLNAFSDTITHMGPVGSGQATKAVNQVIIGGVAQAVCEALALSEKLNLPSARLISVLSAGAAGSWFLDHRGKSMLENRFEKGFKLELLLKDLKIVQALARELDIPVRVVESAIEDYGKLVAAGNGSDDISGLIRLKRQTNREAG